MTFLIRSPRPGAADEREVTPEALYLRRREFLRGAATVAGVVAGALLVPACHSNTDGTSAAAAAPGSAGDAPAELAAIPKVVKGPFATDETQTPYRDATSYNNFYE